MDTGQLEEDPLLNDSGLSAGRASVALTRVLDKHLESVRTIDERVVSRALSILLVCAGAATDLDEEHTKTRTSVAIRAAELCPESPEVRRLATAVQRRAPAGDLPLPWHLQPAAEIPTPPDPTTTLPGSAAPPSASQLRNAVRLERLDKQLAAAVAVGSFEQAHKLQAAVQELRAAQSSEVGSTHSACPLTPDSASPGCSQVWQDVLRRHTGHDANPLDARWLRQHSYAALGREDYVEAFEAQRLAELLDTQLDPVRLSLTLNSSPPLQQLQGSLREHLAEVLGVSVARVCIAALTLHFDLLPSEQPGAATPAQLAETLAEAEADLQSRLYHGTVTACAAGEAWVPPQPSEALRTVQAAKAAAVEAEDYEAAHEAHQQVLMLQACPSWLPV